MKYKILITVPFMITALFFVVGQVEAMGIASECGNLICESGEDSLYCPFDCNPCGDGTCDAGVGETSVTCSVDCSGPICGDGTCDSSESYETCPLDCTLVVDPQPDPGAPSPSCEDVVIHVGEETTCSIKVENVEIFPLTHVVTQVIIPSKVTKVNNTDSWSCMSTNEGIKCQKAYSPYLVMGEIEYLELILTTNIEGKYSLAATIAGSGTQYHAITYNTSESILVTDSTPITATARNDSITGPWGGCSTTIDGDIAANDTLCSSGATSFNYYNLGGGVNVNSFDAATGMINIDLSNGHLFDYDILCNGVVIDNAEAACWAS